MTEAGKVSIKWEAKISDYMSGMKSAQKELNSAMSGVAEFGKKMQKFGLAVAAVGTASLVATTKLARGFSKAGDQINKMALRTGFSEDALSRWKVAAERSGTTIEAVENGIKRMQRSISDAGEGLLTAIRPLERLGISLEDIQKLAPEKQMKIIMERMADLEDPTIKAATAQELFGRAGTQLLPALEGGAKGLEKLMEVADATGEVFTKKGAKAAAEYEDTVRDLQGSLKGLRNELGAQLLPIFKEFYTQVTEAIQQAKDWAADNRELVTTLGKAAIKISALMAALGPLIVGLGTMAVVAPKVAIGIGMIKTVLIATNPILLAAAAAVAGLTLVYGVLASSVNRANKEITESLRLQKETGKVIKFGMESWKLYGSESMAALEKTKLTAADALQVAEGLKDMSDKMLEEGHSKDAMVWIKRAQLYKDFYKKHKKATEDSVEDSGEIDEEAAALKLKLEADALAKKEVFNAGMRDSADALIEGNAEVAISGAIASIFNLLPWPLSTIAAAAARPLITSLIPSFAEGGIVSGTTIARVGEYAGAATNPEVIAPLDKLKGMLGGGMGGSVTVNIPSLVTVGTISPENIESVLYRLRNAAKESIPAAIEFAKTNSSLAETVRGQA